MKLPHLITIGLCILLTGQTAIRAAESIEKELTELAAKLSTQIKEQGKKKVTVLDFTDLQGGSSELGRYIAEELTVNLVMIKRDFSVLDRANLNSILREHKLTASGLVDPENAKKLGMFAGVDALILGNIVPISQNIQLTAKIITTDTAEIVGASKALFQTDETVQQLLSRAAQPRSLSPKQRPLGELEVRVESLKLLPGDASYGYATLTLIVTNTSESTVYGVAIQEGLYRNFNLTNSRGEEFRTTEIAGIDTAYQLNDGSFGGRLTDIPPKTSITAVTKTQVRWDGKPGDYRPYRLQTIVFFGIENQGRYQNTRKHNLLLDIK
ncbi:MAG: CsgG/HfaB family protein [Nitrososphaera sp.]|nr:CsgG/HfaB family protein [Nitrososphaera sp.]